MSAPVQEGLVAEWQARDATPTEALADRSEREAALEAERVDAMREAADLVVEVLEGRERVDEPPALVPALDRVEKLRIELAEAAKGAKQVDAELLMMAEAHEQLRKDNAQLRGMATDQASSAIRAWHGITRIAGALGMETAGAVEVDAVVSRAEETARQARFDAGQRELFLRASDIDGEILDAIRTALGTPGGVDVTDHARTVAAEREQLRADVEILAHKLEAAEGGLRRAEHDLRATVRDAIPAILAGINALGSSEADVRSRNAARDSLHALEAAVEGQPPAAVLSAAERKAVEALRRWRELPDDRVSDPFAPEWLDVLEATDAVIEAGRPLASEGKGRLTMNTETTMSDETKRLQDENEQLKERVERLENAISGARYCLSVENDIAARACLEGNGLEPGVAEDMKTDMDRLYERIEELETALERLR